MAEHKDHWRQLAEELGLPPDEQTAGASPPTAAVQAPPAREAPAPTRVERERPAIQPTPPAPYEALDETEVVSLGEDDLDEPLEEGFGEAPTTELPAGDDETQDDAPPVSRENEDDRRPRRGRRRGRRRGGRDDRPPRGQARAPREKDESQAPGRQERAEDEKSARGHVRPGPERDDEEEAFDERDERDEPEEIVPAIEEDDDADDDLSQFANWNLPSWQELISSLYRPDRNDRER
ncbi:MAG: hypothetical protein L0215_25895 [Gemmataceae bacterium]|nr:hypothetical protein [Gemmataceae bacterium]